MLDFNLSRPQEFMQRMLRDFMQKEYPHTVVREAETTDRGYAPAIYRRLAELGVLGFGVPKAEGGADGGWIDLAVLYEEGGRALLASPHLSSVVLGAGLLVRRGSAAQRQAWVRDLVGGTKVLAVAWPLDAGEPGPSGLSVQVQNGGYLLSGEVAHVPHAVGADGYLLVAEVADSAGRLGLFLAEPSTPGLTVETGPLMSGEPLARLRAQDARLPSEAAVGEPGGGRGDLRPPAGRREGARGGLRPGGCGGDGRHGRGLRQGAPPVQPADWQLPGGAAPPGEPGHPGRRGTAAGVHGGGSARRGPGRAAGRGDGQAEGVHRLPRGVDERPPGTRRLWVHVESNPQLYYRRAKALEFAYGSPDAQRAVIATRHQPFIPT